MLIFEYRQKINQGINLIKVLIFESEKGMIRQYNPFSNIWSSQILILLKQFNPKYKSN